MKEHLFLTPYIFMEGGNFHSSVQEGNACEEDIVLLFNPSFARPRTGGTASFHSGALQREMTVPVSALWLLSVTQTCSSTPGFQSRVSSERVVGDFQHHWELCSSGY